MDSETKSDLMKIAGIAFFWVIFTLAAYATSWGQEINPDIIEYPQEVTALPPLPMICQDGKTPTCHPVSDPLCWDWCNMVEVSVGDAYHWDGDLWKQHWNACKTSLQVWVDHSGRLQMQLIDQANKAEAALQAMRAKCGKKCR